MIKKLLFIAFVFNCIRCLPHIILFFTHKNRFLVRKDVAKWLEAYNSLPFKFVYRSLPLGFIYLLSFHNEYRNLFYARVGTWRFIIRVICKELPTLIIVCNNIGEGLYIEHGFSTAIGAKAIGKNCHINQQVTITRGVVIRDNVKIRAGAVIIGDVTIGNNAVVGANSTVIKDVPDNCTVLPSVSRMVQWNEK